MIQPLLLLLLLAVPPATQLRAGEPALFDGQLLPHSTAARLLVEATACHREVEMAVTATVAVWRVYYDSCRREQAITSSAAAQRVDLWEQHRKDWLAHDGVMEQRVQEAQKSTDTAWFWAKVGGIASAVLGGAVVVLALAK